MSTNKLNKTEKTSLMTKHILRHKCLYIICFSLIFAFIIIKIFFTPNLLTGIDFSYAYFDRNGTLLRLTLSDDEKYRVFVPIENISPTVQEATILYEDRYFKYHFGINPVALVKATSKYISGNGRQVGASTITMQVARIKYDLNTKKPIGKIKQILLAIYLDLFYSKSDIMEAYLNLAPYGSNVEGIGAASLIYFNKKPSELTKIEAITLSTIPQNPVKRSLNSDTGLKNMTIMRKELVARWLEKHKEDSDLTTLADMPLESKRTYDLPFLAPHFINRKLSESKGIWKKLPEKETIALTSLDLKLQKQLEKRLSNEIAKRKYMGVENAAAILVNYKTMEILSYIGSENYFDKKIFGENDGVSAKRSPGSTLKPLIYAYATDLGLIHGMTLLKDSKINFGVYAPENADSEFYGPVLAYTALTHSRNVPAINLTKQIGVKNFYQLLSDMGVKKLRYPEYYGISIALGGAEVSMFELAGIYTTIANLGTRYEIKTEINQEKEIENTVLSPEAFFLVIDMLGRQQDLQTNVPFSQKNSKPKIRHYWKTGTSSSFRDAWTAGIFGDFVLIVWVGNFSGQPNNAFSGAKTAAPIYFGLAKEVENYYKGIGQPIKNNNFLSENLNISQIDMCDKVGGLAGKYCPKSVKAYFIPGKSPIETSSVYQAIPIDNKTGLRACDANPETTHMEVYELWDSEYLDMFKRAGITKNTPPPYVPNCEINNISNNRMQPIIASPLDNTNIVILSDKDYENVPLRALTDMDDKKIFWFLDDYLIGTSFSGETIKKEIPMGNHKIRIVDELGASNSIKINVVK